MAHVVTEACIRCKYTDCVDVCPVGLLPTKAPTFLPLTRTSASTCGVCVPECPVDAIFAEEDIPSGQEHMAELNAELSHLPDWKPITKRKGSLPDAEEWRDRTGKLGELLR